MGIFGETKTERRKKQKKKKMNDRKEKERKRKKKEGLSRLVWPEFRVQSSECRVQCSSVLPAYCITNLLSRCQVLLTSSTNITYRRTKKKKKKKKGE